MKTKIICSFLAGIIVALVAVVLVIFIRSYRDKPILKYTLQGGDLVGTIEQQFEVPYDPLVQRPGIFSDNLLYWRGFAWNAGTRITVCGVSDADTQNAILELVGKEVSERDLCDVEVVFHEETKIEKEGNVIRRLRGAEIRRERFRGVTKDWREQLIQN